jgi:hypothetical protein
MKSLNLLDARLHFNQGAVTRLRSAFESWSSLRNKLKNINLKCNYYMEKKKRSVLKSQWSLWIFQQDIRRKRHRLDHLSFRFRSQLYLSKSFFTWARLQKHYAWKRQQTGLARAFRQNSLGKKYFKTWNRCRDDWKIRFRRNHVFPLAYSGLQLTKRLFSGWREYSTSRKQTQLRIKEANEWQKKQLHRETFILFHDRVYDAHLALAEISNLSPNRFFLALKYGLKWKLKIKSRRYRKRLIHAPPLSPIKHTVRPSRKAITEHPCAFPNPRIPNFLIIPKSLESLRSDEKEHSNPACHPDPETIGNSHGSPPKEQVFDMDQLTKTLIAYSDWYRTYLGKKAELSGLEEQLISYVNMEHSRSAQLDFSSCLEKRSQLVSQLNALERNKALISEIISDIRWQLQSLQNN